LSPGVPYQPGQQQNSVFKKIEMKSLNIKQNLHLLKENVEYLCEKKILNKTQKREPRRHWYICVSKLLYNIKQKKQNER
jgi:flagellar biosynthesis regulator FlbT